MTGIRQTEETYIIHSIKDKMKKILFVIGSTRSRSFNRQVAGYVKSLLDGQAEVSCLDYAEVPFINQDTEFPTPEPVARVRQTVMAADALWVFTPEYNCSYPGIVKNLFDWLSRPMQPNDFTTPTAISGKKVAITGIGGKFFTKGSREKLTELLTFIGAEVMENTVGLRADVDAWTTGTVTIDDEQKQLLSNQKDDFLAFIG